MYLEYHRPAAEYFESVLLAIILIGIGAICVASFIGLLEPSLV